MRARSTGDSTSYVPTRLFRRARKPNDDAQGYLAAIINGSDDAIVSKNLEGIITSWNAGAERLFGYAAREAVGKPVLMLIPEERHDEEVRILSHIRAGKRVDPFETVRRRKDGSLVDVSLTISPISNSRGVVIGASKIARDVTDRKRLAAQQQILVGEMQHRVKNLLAVVEALARQSKPRGEPAVDAFVDIFTARLRALLSTGELVVGSPTRQAELRSIFERVIEPFINPNDPSRFSLSGPSLEVSEQTAGGLALAIHELATNALKYGALKAPRGRIILDWSERSEGKKSRVLIEWKETGCELTAPPQKEGFGSRVIRAGVATEKDGHVEISFEPDGLRCRFEFLRAAEMRPSGS